MRKILFTLLLMLIFIVPLHAQDDVPTLRSATPVRDLDISSRILSLSPDGAFIAGWGDDELCLSAFFITTITNCAEIPATFDSRPDSFYWSSDSRYIAFTQNFFRLYNEPDIWIFDREEFEFTNLTDDGVIGDSGIIMPLDEGDPKPLWDTSPIWNPVTNEIYFVRYVKDETVADEMAMGFYKISPAGGEPELVRDLTGVFQPLSIYQLSEHELDGNISISPDGTKLAIVVAEVKQDSEKNGIWMIDLADDNRLQPLALMNTFREGLPSFFLEMVDAPPRIQGIAWAEDSSGLYVQGFSPEYAAMVQIPNYYLDIETRTVTPLYDFTEVPREHSEYETDEQGRSPMYYQAIGATKIPGLDGIVTLNWDRLGNGEATLNLLRSDGSLTPLYTFPTDEFRGPIPPPHTPSASSDGRILMFGYLFTP